MLLLNTAGDYRRPGEYCCVYPVLAPVHRDLSALICCQRQDPACKHFWFDSVQLILCIYAFLLLAYFAKHTMALHQGEGNSAVTHAGNQLRDTLPNLVLCQMIQQATMGWYKWVLSA